MKTRFLAAAALIVASLGAAASLAPAMFQAPATPTRSATPVRTPQALSTAADWEREGWTAVTTELASYNSLGAGPEATHELDATLVLFDRSGWTKPAINALVEQVAATYRQCGVRLGATQLVSAIPPGGGADISKDRDLFLSQHTPATAPRPVVYFVGKSSDDASSYSYHRGHCNDASCDTVWMLAATNTTQYRKKRSRNYNPLAHELLHVLAQEDHLPIGVQEDNVLGYYSDLRGDVINASQCAKVRRSPAVTALK